MIEVNNKELLLDVNICKVKTTLPAEEFYCLKIISLPINTNQKRMFEGNGELKRPTILVTNDDGFRAAGIEALVEMVKPFGNVVVVAPEEGHSGMSHAITIKTPLRLKT